MRNTQISSLHSLGADAMSNLFDIYVTWPEAAAIASVDQKVKTPMRFQGSFTPPTFSQGSYAVHYKTMSMNRPDSSMKGERKASLEFRVDAYYQIYMNFVRWRNLFFNPDTGLAVTELADASMGKILVVAAATPTSWRDPTSEYRGLIDYPYTYDYEGIPSDVASTEALQNIFWEFNNVWIDKLDEPSFAAGNTATAQKIKVDFQFGAMSTPASNREYNEDYKGAQGSSTAASGSGTSLGTGTTLPAQAGIIT